jgi:ABC-type multidrug transport system fused ATPase/permease subunit
VFAQVKASSVSVITYWSFWVEI